MLSPDFVGNKLKEYESFLETTLKRDLAEVQVKLLDKVEKYKEWQEVKEVTKALKEFREKNRDMCVRVGLGNGVNVTAEVSDYERTYVDIGLGFLLEMDCEEADKYSEIRLRQIKRDIEHHRELAVRVKVNMKLVLLAMSELQGLK